MAYSLDLRKKVLIQIDKKVPIVQIARAFSISPKTVRAWRKKRNSGNLNHSAGGFRYSKLDKNKLLALLEEHPDYYLHEYAKELGVSTTTVFYALKSMKITIKKNDNVLRARSGKR